MSTENLGEVVIDVVISVEVVIRTKTADSAETGRYARYARKRRSERQLDRLGHIRRSFGAVKPDRVADDCAIRERIARLIGHRRANCLNASKHPTISGR